MDDDGIKGHGGLRAKLTPTPGQISPHPHAIPPAEHNNRQRSRDEILDLGQLCSNSVSQGNTPENHRQIHQSHNRNQSKTPGLPPAPEPEPQPEPAQLHAAGAGMAGNDRSNGVLEPPNVPGQPQHEEAGQRGGQGNQLGGDVPVADMDDSSLPRASD